jgi:hypothetical protein
MSRYRFGVWGIELDDEGFAAALAGAGMRGNPSGGIIEFRAPELPPRMDPKAAHAQWIRARSSVKQVEVTDPGDLDPLWLTSMLARALPDGGVYFLRNEPEVAVAWEWEWPLRIGLFAGDRSDELRTALRGTSTDRAVRFVEVGRERAECELLLIPCNLRASVERVLTAAAPITADCTVILGGAKVEGNRVDALLSVVRGEVRTAGVAVASVPKDVRPEWLRALIAHLSRRNTIDVALCQAARETKLEAPLLLCSRKLAELATQRAIPRMTARAAPPPPQPPPAAALESTLESFIPPEAPKAAAAEAAVSVERFLQASFFDQSKTIRQPVLAPRSACFLRLHIGRPSAEGVVANVPLDESQLPPSASGHELTIALFELREDDHEPASPPSRMSVHLPAEKERPSTEAWFPILAPAAGAFMCRILVLHQTRVLQTLLFRAPVGAPESKFTLAQENVIHPTFEILGARRAFDVALVVNEAGGKTAVMGVTKSSVAYNEPEGIAASIEAIAKSISELTALPDKVKLKDAAVVKVLIRLANHGKLLADWIAAKLPPEVASAERIQLVEARLGAFLPLEFVYPSYAPKKTAKLCPHGITELAAPRKTKCPNERDRDFVCPSVFWGFNRVIERWPHMDLEGNFDYQLSVPKPDRTKLDPFEGALVGASSRVSAADVTTTKKALKPLLKSEAHVVAKWDDWPDAIKKYSPSLLVLFPHSEEDDGIAALEVGKEFLQVSALESDYVRPEGREPGPIVLLLGCSTKLPRIAFHDFVARFRMKGASMVVGTLSLIRGRHATRFVQEFMAVLRKRAGTPNAVFGDVLLETKQSMLAAGDPFALTLVAYGDADWQL